MISVPSLFGAGACGGSVDDGLFGTPTSSASTGSGAGASGPGSSSASATGGGGPGAGGASSVASSGPSGSTGGTTGSAGAGGATSSGGAGGGPACPSIGDACSDCASVQCSDLYCACYQSAECTALVVCYAGCAANDGGCYQACMTNHKDGISDSFLLGDCAATSCTGACPAAQPLEPCAKCLYAHCEAQMNTCLASADCNALLQCTANCSPGDTICIQLCEAGHPLSVPALGSISTCLNQSCASECG